MFRAQHSTCSTQTPVNWIFSLSGVSKGWPNWHLTHIAKRYPTMIHRLCDHSRAEVP